MELRDDRIELDELPAAAERVVPVSFSEGNCTKVRSGLHRNRRECGDWVA